MNLPYLVLAASSVDWQAIALFVNAGVFALGFFLTIMQLSLNRRSRDTEDRISISQSNLDHNTLILKDKRARSVVASLEGLNVPKDKDEEDSYWTYRGVHLSHINLIWRVWELGGQPKRGKDLYRYYNGWQRFAQKIVAKKLKAAADAVASGEKEPQHLAGADIWKGLSDYESIPVKLTDWLGWLAEKAGQPGDEA